MSATHTEEKNNDELIAMLSELEAVAHLPEPEKEGSDVIESKKTSGLTDDLFSELLPLTMGTPVPETNDSSEIAALLVGIEDEIETPAPAAEPEKTRKRIRKASKDVETVIEADAKPEPEPESEPVPAVKKAKTWEKITRKRFSMDDLDAGCFEAAGLDRVEFMKAYNDCPVKAMDKAQNFMAWHQGMAEMSVYTTIVITHLINNGTSDTAGIRLAMMNNPTKPYPAPTASTQAGQMMSVLPALGIATKDGKTLTLNPDSPLVQKFKSEAM